MRALRVRSLRRCAFEAALAAAFALVATAAHASAFDVEGFGPTGVAEVNARVARADDGSAAFYSPGGLGLGEGVRVELAPTLGVSALDAQKKNIALSDPFGITLAFDATIPLEGALKDRLRFGFAGYFLPTSVAHVLVRAETSPFFPYYDNRTQRLVLMPALALRVSRGFAIGAAVNVLGGVSGPASVEKGASGAPESRIDVEAQTIAAANLGVRFDPTDAVHVAFAFRQKFSVPSNVATTATVGGIPLAVSVDGAQNLFDPDTFVVGTSFDAGRFTFEVDGSYAAWSSYTGPFATVQASLPGVNIESAVPAAIARDVVSVRGAADASFDVGRHALVLRAGLGFEPSMLRSFQQTRSNLVDGDKLLAGAGATLALHGLVKKTLRVGVGVNAAFVRAYSQAKKICEREPCASDELVGPDAAHPGAGIQNPGSPRLEGGGAFVSASIGVGVDL